MPSSWQTGSRQAHVGARGHDHHRLRHRRPALYSLHGALAAAKGALEVLTAYLACELAPQGIRVNGVNPGFVNTDSAHVFGEKIYNLLEKKF